MFVALLFIFRPSISVGGIFLFRDIGAATCTIYPHAHTHSCLGSLLVVLSLLNSLLYSSAEWIMNMARSTNHNVNNFVS
jgi:hypothetical protein